MTDGYFAQNRRDFFLILLRDYRRIPRPCDFVSSGLESSFVFLRNQSDFKVKKDIS